MTDRGLLERLVGWTRLDGTQRVLDVACGPGLVATALAPHARLVVGVDVTEAMLVRGREIAAERTSRNVVFVHGDVTTLPFPDGTFERVVSRRAFHHFPDPVRVLAEMARVCTTAGLLVIEDQALPDHPDAAAAMTTIDRLRDPSHTSAVSPQAWPDMLAACGFAMDAIEVAERELEVEEWLPRAHPTAANAARVREMLAGAARGEIAGLAARWVEDRLRFSLGLQLLRATRLRE
jgi:SAM-dependent methyltransferase